jgi:hypothetical protein
MFLMNNGRATSNADAGIAHVNEKVFADFQHFGHVAIFERELVAMASDFTICHGRVLAFLALAGWQFGDASE